MKRIISTILLVLAVSPLALGQTAGGQPGQGRTTDKAGRDQGGRGGAAVKDQLIGLERQAWEAWKNKNGGYFQTFLSDDSIGVGAQGIARKAQIVSGISGSPCDIKGYTLDNFDLVMLDRDAAILTFKATQEATCGGVAEPSPVWASTVYVKRGGKWQAAFHQETPAAQTR